MRARIPVFEADFGFDERSAIHQHIAKDAFITAGKEVERFEREFAMHVGRQFGVMTNSGSSALLIAIAAMGWERGDKIVTPAVTFPTSVSPLLHFGCIPVFVDVELGTYNVDMNKLEDTVKKTGARGAVLPHTLGNPLPPEVWGMFEKTVEDSCDAFDSRIGERNCGTFGTVSTFSFFPAHHLCTGEGGMALCGDSRTHSVLFKLANWGRACICRPGYDDTCKNRFGHEVDGISYDHKYSFDEPGFNVKPLELCGVLGRKQLTKAGRYRDIRKRNFRVISGVLRGISKICLPKIQVHSDPNWFGFPVTLLRGNRKDITRKIEARGVATRLVFAGNLTRHPMMKKYAWEAPCGLEESDRVMRDSFIVGANHVMTEAEAEYVAQVVKEEIER